MALVKCKECGVQVSNKAKTCPACGAKVPKKTSIVKGLVFIIIFIWLFLSFVAALSPDTSSNYSKPRASTSTSSSSSTSAQSRAPNWLHHTSKDEMTGKKQEFATSDKVVSTKPMEFPYSGTKAWMGIGCDGSNEWAYIGFSGSPNLNNTDTESGYDIVTTRVRWDDVVQQTKFTQKWGDSFLHFRSTPAAIAKIAGAKTMLLELDWHGQRPVYFEFSLDGSSDAIKKMRASCR